MRRFQAYAFLGTVLHLEHCAHVNTCLLSSLEEEITLGYHVIALNFQLTLGST